MESFEEAAADGECMHAVVKRKRTKRQRLLLQPPATTSSSSSSSGEVSAAGTIITEEEEDMANCLILLARGQAFDAGLKPEAIVEDAANASEPLTSRRIAETTTTTNVKAGFYVYECKTCNKCFPSFQALGGHRASHKKPKIGTAPSPLASEKKTVSVMIDEDELRMNSFVNPIILSGNRVIKTKVHECSICGAEFSSGQALGGHMRRHRPLSVPEAQEGKKEQSLLSLDLNLPAPSDDEQGEFPRTASEAFAFVEKRPPLLFSASALVGCHY